MRSRCRPLASPVTVCSLPDSATTEPCQGCAYVRFQHRKDAQLLTNTLKGASCPLADFVPEGAWLRASLGI